jgi:mutator protein MutT
MVEREVATVAFYDEEKKVLLQDRKSISKFGEEWGFFGGSLEEGETPTEAVIREIQEELGYELQTFEMFKHYQGTTPTGISFIEHVYLAPFPGFNKLTQTEGDNMELFTIEKAKTLKILPTYQDILQDLQEHFMTKEEKKEMNKEIKSVG